MAFICGDCHKEHPVPTREEDRGGQPCVEALARGLEEYKDLLAKAVELVDGCCQCLGPSWLQYKKAKDHTRQS
jgi:hypothetical protein